MDYRGRGYFWFHLAGPGNAMIPADYDPIWGLLSGTSYSQRPGLRFDNLSITDQREYTRLYESLGRPTADNRSQLDALLNQENTAIRWEFYTGKSTGDLRFSIGGDYDPRVVQTVDDYVTLRTGGLTPLRALSQDVGNPSNRSWWDDFSRKVAIGALAAMTGGAIAEAAAGGALEAGTYGAEASVAEAGVASGIPEYIALPVAQSEIPIYIAAGTQPAAQVGTTLWATDTVSAALNPGLFDVGASLNLPQSILDKAKSIGVKQATGAIAAKYLGNSAAYTGAEQEAESAAPPANWKPVLLLGAGLLGVFFLIRFLRG
jgi:hypothetical protein